MACCKCWRHWLTHTGSGSWPPWPRSATTSARLARSLGISRALLQVHLRKLEAAGLVSAAIEVSEDGKAMKFYEVTPFALHLTPEVIMTAARTLGPESELEAGAR